MNVSTMQFRTGTAHGVRHISGQVVFDEAFQGGRMAVDSLLTEIESADEQLCSFAHRAAWRPDKTHKRTL